MKFGTLTQIAPYRGHIVKIFNFSKTKMAAAAILKSYKKNCDIKASDRPIFAKFGTITQNGSLNHPDR